MLIYYGWRLYYCAPLVWRVHTTLFRPRRRRADWLYLCGKACVAKDLAQLLVLPNARRVSISFALLIAQGEHCCCAGCRGGVGRDVAPTDLLLDKLDGGSALKGGCSRDDAL